MKKGWPSLRSGEEVERFVAEADLTEHDFSRMVPVRFALRHEDKPAQRAAAPQEPWRRVVPGCAGQS